MIYLYIFYRLVLVFFIPAGCLYFFLVSLLSYQRNHQTSSLKTKEIKCLQRHSDRLFMSTISSTSDKTDPQLQWILYCSIHRSLGSTDLRPIHKLANHDSNSRDWSLNFHTVASLEVFIFHASLISEISYQQAEC